MYSDHFLQQIEEAKQPFDGWDFSYVEATGRIQYELLPWSYGSMTHSAANKAGSILDMGTGGGEFLSIFSKSCKSAIKATEAYEPNVPIARKQLEPLGIQVSHISDDHSLPFLKGEFDLVLNRHESYDPAEVKRIMSEGAIFLTQQVGGTDCNGINAALGKPANLEFSHWNMAFAVEELKNSGFTIVDCKEAFPVQRFYDIGSLVYYLKAIPWQVPDFSIEKDLDSLYRIHQQLTEDGYFNVYQHRFIIKAQAKV
ncbi:class I SAM-dependent methyltransferase [Bacillus sp. 1P06AnD]|uniref:class I SAM-dependent methyltransferase n=1 Tax=Bacillus sp. 1P06AnD TaxID=3132208 RepID=UPI0039A0A5F5